MTALPPKTDHRKSFQTFFCLAIPLAADMSEMVEARLEKVKKFLPVT